MSNPVRIQIRGDEKVRELWKRVEGKFDDTYAALAKDMCRFVLENEEQFEKFRNTEWRTEK